jgi:hypothetical protein
VPSFNVVLGNLASYETTWKPSLENPGSSISRVSGVDEYGPCAPAHATKDMDTVFSVLSHLP